MKLTWRLGCAISMAAASLSYLNQPLSAQPPVPEMLDPDLSVRMVVGGLTTPIGVAFLPGRSNDNSGHDDDRRGSGDRDGDNSGPGSRDGDRRDDDRNRRSEMFVIEKSTGQVKLVVERRGHRARCSTWR